MSSIVPWLSVLNYKQTKYTALADRLSLQQMPYLASNAKNLTKNRKN